ncbi:dihydrolipoamide acetyltransferase family protein [Aquimarina pacifica]|uniref:dihydrolipoamide acetyltransferase family protein n=1 Tax=Aquimarina pacifica TaxID=1296415 RepID=UPI000471CC30|nr:dihydrolipoamide acetyltransferase family protein [Aquimarina pacifica]
MAEFELKLPKMGESVAEATITTWLKEVGDTIEMDDAVVEIATDKVDSEVPSEVEGVLVKKLFEVDDVVKVGQTIAVIQTNGEAVSDSFLKDTALDNDEDDSSDEAKILETQMAAVIDTSANASSSEIVESDKFYSPLVKNIASAEGVSELELDTIEGTGKDGRVTKNDILKFIENRSNSVDIAGIDTSNTIKEVTTKEAIPAKESTAIVSGEDEIIEMTRMGKLVSQHMIDSINTSAHVQSFIEADVTNIWNWRNKVKTDFMNREGENLTFTPIFIESVAKALRDFPMMNISVKGSSIIKKKNINIGMATALADGNLIVPVIKNADQLNLVGVTKAVNDLANRSRNNSLKPDDIQDGTYTVTNVGSFGSIMGTPIINQPQVGILALGAIRKVPAVIETPEGDFIGIRYRMFLSHSYDHRVVNGALGGQFVQRVKEYLEAWDVDRQF